MQRLLQLFQLVFEVLTLEQDFLLAVWHEKYTDLKGEAMPLFVTRVKGSG